MLEILLFLLAGTALGIVLGLLPGIHPNMIILAVPLMASLNLETPSLIAFVVSLGIANTFAEFVPSILLSAADDESGLATLPGQRMLAAGRGLAAIRLAITGGIVATAICSVALPLLILTIPTIYSLSRGVIWVALLAIATLMVVSERSRQKIFWAAVCFVISGIIGLLSFRLPIDRTIILFPVFTGMFALPHLFLQIKENVNVPPQQEEDREKTKTFDIKSSALGALGGVVSGLLPGVGSSEIASLLTMKNDDESFMSTIGALAASNITVSFLALWLIGNPRSGVAVALDQLISVDARAFATIVFSIIIATAIAACATLLVARKMLNKLQKINYVRLSQIIFLFLVAAVAFFAGPLGLLVMAACAGLGLFVNIIEVKRGIMMGVLILPTILFFLGV